MKVRLISSVTILPSGRASVNNSPLPAYQRAFFVMYFVHNQMTSSIPNGFSTEDLESMLNNARHEDDCRCDDCAPSGEGPHGDQGLTDDEVIEAASKLIDDSLEVCNDPLFHKVVAMTIVTRLMCWHKEIAEKQESEQSSGAWMRDAGKLQAVMDIMCSVSVGPNDFTCEHQ